MKKLLILLLTIAVMSSCTTISEKAAEREAEVLLEVLSENNPELAAKMTARPFLFESEILISEGLVLDLWAGLAALDFSGARVSGYSLVENDSYQFFDESWEVETWMNNYTDEDTALIFFNWQSREFVIVVDRRTKSKQRIQGFGEITE